MESPSATTVPFAAGFTTSTPSRKYHIDRSVVNAVAAVSPAWLPAAANEPWPAEVWAVIVPFPLDFRYRSTARVWPNVTGSRTGSDSTLPPVAATTEPFPAKVTVREVPGTSDAPELDVATPTLTASNVTSAG